MLRVFYGWTKTNKIRKVEAISIIYENRKQNEEKVQNFIKRMQETVYTRFQTDKEAADGEKANRMFTEYSIRMDDKHVKGDLEAALDINYLADANNVPQPEREEIRKQLRNHWRMNHSI